MSLSRLFCFFSTKEAVFTRRNDLHSDVGFFIDERDNRKYKTIQIGRQVWMAENLAFEPDYGNYWVERENSHGCFYDWATAKKVAPRGWRLPSKGDYQKLLLTLGGPGENAYKSLIDGGWSGFNADFDGWRRFTGEFRWKGLYSCCWTASRFITGSVWYLYLRNSDFDANLYRTKKEAGMFVRCIKK